MSYMACLVREENMDKKKEEMEKLIQEDKMKKQDSKLSGKILM